VPAPAPTPVWSIVVDDGAFEAMGAVR